MKRISSTLLITLLALSVLQLGFLAQKKIKIRQYKVAERQDGAISIQFHLYRAFRSDIREKISSGAEVSFTYHIRLYRVRPYYPDDLMDEIRILTSVRYDRLTREYHLSRSIDGEPDSQSVTKYEEEMRRWMTNIKIVAFDGFRQKPSRSYQVRVKAIVQKDFTLFMIPNDFDTVWRKQTIPPSG